MLNFCTERLPLFAGKYSSDLDRIVSCYSEVKCFIIFLISPLILKHLRTFLSPHAADLQLFCFLHIEQTRCSRDTSPEQFTESTQIKSQMKAINNACNTKCYPPFSWMCVSCKICFCILHTNVYQPVLQGKLGSVPDDISKSIIKLKLAIMRFSLRKRKRIKENLVPCSYIY